MGGYRWGWRQGRGPGRPMKPRRLERPPEIVRFIPIYSESGSIQRQKEPIVMTPDELEALRLVDYEGLLQEEAARRMGVSRGTVWRCLDRARKKVATMLTEGHELIIVSSEIHSSDKPVK